jgi:methyl-accepting chemotaxis protein WspA
MKNRTVKQYIVLGFSSMMVIVVLLSAFAFVLLYQIRGRVADIAMDSLPGLFLSGQIKSLSLQTLGLVGSHVMSSDALEKRELDSGIAANQLKLDDLLHEYEKTIVQSHDRELFNDVMKARTDCQNSYEAVLDVSRGEKSAEAQAALQRQTNGPCKDFQSAADAEVMDNKQVSEAAIQGILGVVSRAELAVILSLLVGIVVALVGSGFLIRAINRLVLQVHEAGLKVSTSSAEIAATSQAQLSTANEIAATTSEIGATSKQISVTSKELVQAMKEVADVAERTKALANKGQSGLERMRVTGQQILGASSSINDRLNALSDKASNIGAVVATITKVADQTNLLSLNAAIEAEKAGEYGRGFAVVAVEIRRLADQTAVSTSDIEQTAKQIHSAVSASIMGMDKFSEEVRRGVEAVKQVSDELSEIISQVQTLTPSFEAVSEGMQSQSLGAQQITDALSQLTEATTQTVGSLRQSSIAVEQLNEAARGLQHGVSRFALNGSN